MKYCMGAIRNLYEISCRFPVKLPRTIEKGHVVRFVTDMLFNKNCSYQEKIVAFIISMCYNKHIGN